MRNFYDSIRRSKITQIWIYPFRFSYSKTCRLIIYESVAWTPLEKFVRRSFDLFRMVSRCDGTDSNLVDKEVVQFRTVSMIVQYHRWNFLIFFLKDRVLNINLMIWLLMIRSNSIIKSERWVSVRNVSWHDRISWPILDSHQFHGHRRLKSLIWVVPGVLFWLLISNHDFFSQILL